MIPNRRKLTAAIVGLVLLTMTFLFIANGKVSGFHGIALPFGWSIPCNTDGGGPGCGICAAVAGTNLKNDIWSYDPELHGQPLAYSRYDGGGCDGPDRNNLALILDISLYVLAGAGLLYLMYRMGLKKGKSGNDKATAA